MAQDEIEKVGGGGAGRDYAGSYRSIKRLKFLLESRSSFFFLIINMRLIILSCMFKRLLGGGQGNRYREMSER